MISVFLKNNALWLTIFVLLCYSIVFVIWTTRLQQIIVIIKDNFIFLCYFAFFINKNVTKSKY